MDLGFNGDLAGLAAASGAITKWVGYPLAQLRRRKDSDGDGHEDDTATGAYYLHPDLHGPATLSVVVALGVAAAAALDLALFPVLSAVATGWAGARAAHEGAQVVRR